MRLWIIVLALVCASVIPSGLPAQDQEYFRNGPSGSAYLDSVRYRGIETQVKFADPAVRATFPETAETELPGKQVLVDLDTVSVAVTAAVLIGLAALVWLASGSFSLSFQAEAANAARQRPDRLGRTFNDGRPVDLKTILAMADRQRALVLLAQAALARTVSANGILVQPSWTMRDMLSHIPKGQAHFDALRSLAMAGERVLFGNGSVSEAEFQERLSAIRPLLAQGTA
jgi:hypothetical protein